MLSFQGNVYDHLFQKCFHLRKKIMVLKIKNMLLHISDPLEI
jgi:hypothetical protein